MEAKGEKGIGAKFVVCVVNMKASVYIHVTSFTSIWFFSNLASFFTKEHLIPLPVSTGIQGLAYIDGSLYVPKVVLG